MAGPVSSIDQVPLGDVLPIAFNAVEGDLWRLARDLEAHQAAAGRTIWHWWLDRTERPPTLAERESLTIVSGGVMLYDSGVDWLELDLDIGWGPELTVTASVHVACWCAENHNAHYVLEACWPVATAHDLIEGFAAGTAILTEVLNTAPFDPSIWRVQAGLPDAPGATS
ncbi:hypothetical protein GCM10010399_64350 [Dactylosporangium fulvum]|uniref:Uncharacterized protein n=1 Tax=Dactylosporangium fulvum TaxID=53359 RepID=A0ABY5W779_9ACTN|nr:hypothetical protein [Dactylosporangium fulvum]UWP85742.1 hypothetical protein Dfulv_16470 [Dactylosporangium fulvum]